VNPGDRFQAVFSPIRSEGGHQDYGNISEDVFDRVRAGFAAEPALIGKDNNTMKEMLESSQNEKKSVTLYVKGQSFGGLVIKVAGEFVELRNREFNQILIRIDAIDAAAMS